MKKIVCITLLMVSMLARGQEYPSWPNEKSEWYYEVQPIVGCFPCIVKFQHIMVIGDTLIHDKACMIIEKSSPGIICDDMGKTKEYLYYEAQILYWYNEQIDDFTVLYDFSAEKGSTWEVTVSDCSFTVHVDSISSISIDGSLRKIIHISDERNYFSGSIIEQIGHTTSMFPKDIYYECAGWACDSDFTNGLRCYLENGEVVFRKGTVDCDSIYQLDAIGQYISIFGENSTFWTVKHENLHGVMTDTLMVLGDTIVNDNIYRVISTPFKRIYLHENLTEGRLTYFTNFDNTEKLLMDLSLNLGDIFKVEGAWLSQQGYFEVDSVYEKDQRKHVQLNLPLQYANNQKLTFIEGIGPNTGLSYQDSPTGELNPYLLCYWRDDQQAYSNTYYKGECSVVSSSKVDSPKNPNPFFEVFPNPVTSNNFKVVFASPFKGHLALMDISGNIVMKKTVAKSLLQETILLPDLQFQGVYILRIQNEEGIIQSQKIAIIY